MFNMSLVVGELGKKLDTFARVMGKCRLDGVRLPVHAGFAVSNWTKHQDGSYTRRIGSKLEFAESVVPHFLPVGLTPIRSTYTIYQNANGSFYGSVEIQEWTSSGAIKLYPSTI